jgi:hypothetical protein
MGGRTLRRQRRCVSIFLDKNRRHTGTSQSKRRVRPVSEPAHVTRQQHDTAQERDEDLRQAAALSQLATGTLGRQHERKERKRERRQPRSTAQGRAHRCSLRSIARPLPASTPSMRRSVSSGDSAVIAKLPILKFKAGTGLKLLLVPWFDDGGVWPRHHSTSGSAWMWRADGPTAEPSGPSYRAARRFRSHNAGNRAGAAKDGCSR